MSRPHARAHLRVIHPSDCTCLGCSGAQRGRTPLVSAAPQVDPYADDGLTLAELGTLALLGASIGSAIAFAYDPVGSWAALREAVLVALGAM